MAIIEVEHLTKEFRLGQLQSLGIGLKNLAARLGGRPSLRVAPFTALDDVSIRIEPGEVVGLVGHNGAGKSTLLKLLSRVTTPTRGTVRVHGRISPLIEVTGGFMQELTGRENIFLSGTILGMSRREIRRKFDEIVAFAELERFIDTPLKRYSSGMYIRLGFSVATHVDADVLLIDEVLAVGDVAFQRKCFDLMEKIISNNEKTLLVVGHNIRQIERICKRAILLERGRVVEDGAATDVCAAFLESMQSRINSEHIQRFNKVGAEFTTEQVDVAEVKVITASTSSCDAAGGPPALTVQMDLIAHESIPEAEIVVGIQTPDLLYVTEASSAAAGVTANLAPGSNRVTYSIPEHPIHPGAYGIALTIYDRMGRCLWRGDNLAPFEIYRPTSTGSGMTVRGIVDLPCKWVVDGSDGPVAEATVPLVAESFGGQEGRA